MDGEELAGAEAATLVGELARRISAAVMPEGFMGAALWAQSHGGSANATFESSVLDFAREVLLCSSRTVTGGDAYDAVDLVSTTHPRSSRLVPLGM